MVVPFGIFILTGFWVGSLFSTVQDRLTYILVQTELMVRMGGPVYGVDRKFAHLCSTTL